MMPTGIPLGRASAARRRFYRVNAEGQATQTLESQLWPDDA